MLENKTDVTEKQEEQVPAVIADVESFRTQLAERKEVRDLTSEIDINDENTIIDFGQAPAAKISEMADRMLLSTKAVDTTEITAMVDKLTKIMKTVNLDDFDPSKKNAFQKLFNKAKNSLDSMMEKYTGKNGITVQLDAIYQQLRTYEVQIRESNAQLNEMYEANIAFYEQLEKYIVAGGIGKEEIRDFQGKIERGETDISPSAKQNMISRLELMYGMLDQRIYDLEIAEQVAQQTCPMLGQMKMVNFNLQRKINTAFIITLPIFKQCITQAIIAKRQEVQAKSLGELDKATQEMYMKTVQRTQANAVNAARLANSSAFDIDKLRESYNTIMQGIEDTNRINAEAAAQRSTNRKELESMTADMKKKGLI